MQRFVYEERSPSAGGRYVRRVWEFIFLDGVHPQIVLDRFTIEGRESSRHRFRLAREYRRLYAREIEAHFRMDLADVPEFPDDLCEDVRGQLVDQVRIVREQLR